MKDNVERQKYIYVHFKLEITFREKELPHFHRFKEA